MTASIKSYIKEKCELLRDLGIDDAKTLTTYLSEEIANDPNDSARTNHIDRLCRVIIDKYFEGDKTFCNIGNKAEYYHRIIKRNYPNAETLYEDVILNLVGPIGLTELRKAHRIETCAMFNGRKLYAI